MDTLMSITPPAGGKAATMSSREIAELVQKRHDNVKRTIETLSEQGTIVHPQIEDEPIFDTLGRARTEKVYRVNERDSFVVVAQLSPEFTARLVDYWQTHRNNVPRLPTTAEAFAEVFRMAAEAERVQAQQTAAIQAIDAKVEKVAQAHVILDKMPSDCESIMRVRVRMASQYGLSEKVVDKVMRDSPFAPTIRCLVRNAHVDADGAHYSGFAKKEVSAIFKRFVSECKRVTATMCTHPYVDGRFKLVASN